MKNLKELLVRSGISGGELAAVMHVSRMSVWRWANSDAEPRQELTRITCTRILDLIETAVERGLLPLKDVPQAEHIATIKRVLKAVA